ncbi:MAG TPA: universal stress protein [Acidimicrobiales bacterium]|nr:universal stress protein [Acidimicrobiales bacterium]
MGYDRSPESVAALHAVTGILGDRLGRLTVATVAPFGDVRESERKHEELLRHLVTDVPGYHLRLEILHGHPATALRERAASGSYGLLALGTRGRGLATAIVGSTADSLASESTTPVLLSAVPSGWST